MGRLRQSADSKLKSDSSDIIKATALQMFAQHGVDGVTVREIATAAGQKNHGAVGYYFGSKEALLREIITDGAKIIDERRNAMIDALEQSGNAPTVRALIDTIIYPSLNPFDDAGQDSYMRLTVLLNLTHRDIFVSAIGNQWNRGYQRALSHLRKLMPAMPAAMKNQRLLFIGSYIAMTLALRQTALSDTTRAHSTWSSDATLDHLAHTAVAIIKAPVGATLPDDGDPPLVSFP